MSSKPFLRALFCASFFAITAIGFSAQRASAEGRIEPPLELLYAPENQLVVGTLTEINPAGRLVFRRDEVLSGRGKPPAQIDVRVSQPTLSKVTVGQRYVFGYSAQRNDPRDPTRIIANPEGPILITSIGLEPALFHDTPTVRAVLKAGSSERGRESKRTFDLLMQALDGPDPQLQNLAAGEIAQGPEIGERLRQSGHSIVEKIARDPHTPPGVRASLIQSASERPRDLGDWWQAAAIEVVTTTPVDGYADMPSDPTGLVLVALDALDKHAITLPPDALKRWVWSANSSLSEHACLNLRRESPALERTAITDALADPKLPTSTRQFLNDHLRRLDLLDKRLRAQKDGTDRS
ncbi:MAG: hypothetical protein ABI082_06720 [Dokdonella sp.]